MLWINSVVLSIFVFVLMSCAPPDNNEEKLDTTIIYSAKTILTLDEKRPLAQAIAVKDGTIRAVGSLSDLKSQYPEAKTDTRFDNQVIVPGLID
ncbi:MAG: hypothetical protein JKX72_12210, partial [Robiginitomaculum sp.]|nr:hypothetical protein [Robiginitomaculum sp.]